jgi:ABC-type iron transport system FetAB permease component
MEGAVVHFAAREFAHVICNTKTNTHSECQKLSRIIRGGGMNIQTHLALGARPKTRFTTRSRAATQKHEIPQHKKEKVAAKAPIEKGAHNLDSA